MAPSPYISGNFISSFNHKNSPAYKETDLVYITVSSTAILKNYKVLPFS